MKNPNTLAAVLDSHFRQAFRQGIKDLSDPGDTMNHSNVRENTDFAKLLHKEGLWSLYTYNGKTTGKSLLYHLCRTYTGHELVNSPVSPKTGDCSACGSKSPDEIRGLWTLHNFDWIQQSSGEPSIWDYSV